MYIVGHVSPDWDCIAALWLLIRYAPGFDEARVELVNTSSPDPAILAGASAVVDTGKVLDPARLRFDHHQLPATEAQTSATKLVWEHLNYAQTFDHLAPLIGLINAGDLGHRDDAIDTSRAVGLHAQLSARKAAKWDDYKLLDWGFGELDLLADHLLARQQARAMLEQHVVYRSDDGLIVALDRAPQAASFAAQEAGARLVLFHSLYPETVAVGCTRAAEWQEPHVGRLVEYILTTAAQQMIGAAHYEYVAPELATWYCHPAGFFAGRGTPKAPDARPLDTDLVIIARLIDEAWTR